MEEKFEPKDCLGNLVEVGDTIVFGEAVKAGTLTKGTVVSIKPRYKREPSYDEWADHDYSDEWRKNWKSQLIAREANMLIERPHYWRKGETEIYRMYKLNNICVVKKGNAND
jgi:hypothetical protein